jgi:hypothetical protein
MIWYYRAERIGRAEQPINGRGEALRLNRDVDAVLEAVKERGRLESYHRALSLPRRALGLLRVGTRRRTL